MREGRGGSVIQVSQSDILGHSYIVIKGSITFYICLYKDETNEYKVS